MKKRNLMIKRVLSVFLVICAFAMMIAPVSATANSFTFSAELSESFPAIGKEFDVVISMNHYEDTNEEIRGMQIDVSDIDTSVLEVVSHESLIVDSSATSNQTSYSAKNHYVRYVYLKTAGSMDKSVSDVIKIRFKVREDLTEDGTVTLPVKYKIGTLSGNNITLTDSITINYRESFVSVDITWGDLEFDYYDGAWDVNAHKRAPGSWQPASDNGNMIKVNNSGNTDVSVAMTYEPGDGFTSLDGEFKNSDDAKITSPVALASGSAEQNFWFYLIGEPDSRWADSYVPVGNIKLTITE